MKRRRKEGSVSINDLIRIAGNLYCKNFASPGGDLYLSVLVDLCHDAAGGEHVMSRETIRKRIVRGE